jgi:hypothetical protein
MTSLECRYNNYGERLRADGLRVFRTAEEEYLFRRLGMQELVKLFDSCLEYACVERKFLQQVTGQKLDREAFKELNEMRRRIAIGNITNLCQQHDKTTGNYNEVLDLVYTTPEEMLETIRQNYRGQQMEHVLAKLHKAKKKSID